MPDWARSNVFCPNTYVSGLGFEGYLKRDLRNRFRVIFCI